MKDEAMNVITVKKPPQRRATSVVRISGEAADTLWGFSVKSGLTLSQVATNFIQYAAEHTVIREEE